ncbi:MAG: hypothetical protein AMJ53_17925 [Gammaproteobacteria bacterium SG8_11]|nr:MAG: hypothetical protein AMJ53_17925 [Gammaproteobacteria bacterium SG8_11]
MSVNPQSQLNDIHSMLASGHRSIQLERHTLILWGLAAAFLILVVPILFAPEYFEFRWQRAVAQNLFMSVLLAIVGVVDYKLTRRIRAQRNETVSFVQRQLTKVWWLLVGLIVVINLGMNFFGGGYIFFAVALVIAGLALYIQGLFSQQMLCWVGGMMMVVGLASVALKIPHPEMKWLAASVFGLGLPAVAWLIHRPRTQWTLPRRLIVSSLWLAMVVTPASVAYQLTKNSEAPNLPVVSLQQYMAAPTDTAQRQVVRLPAGTTIPINVDINGDILDGTTSGTLVMRLSEDLELVIEDNKPNARFRVGDGIWKHRRYNYRLREFKNEMTVSKEHGPEINLQMQISTNN